MSILNESFVTGPAASAPLRTQKVPCGICESSCGLEATLSGGQLLHLRPDMEHPNSRGFACTKGISFPLLRNDPDRVLHPLQRQPDGSFKRVGWDEALDDIGARLSALIGAHGKECIGMYLGNPIAWNHGAAAWLFGLGRALKTKHIYSASSVDINNYWVVSQLLFGHCYVNPFPDVKRADFMMLLGFNPAVSHGSMMTTGRLQETLLGVTERGGRVVVVDPRRTETAVLFEHVPIMPDADAWLLAAMLKVVLDEGLGDRQRLATQTTGSESLAPLVAGIDLQRAAQETGIAVATLQGLARDFARAKAGAIFGRFGASVGSFSTLTHYLIVALNIVTGKLDREGGLVFGVNPLDAENTAHRAGDTGYGRWHTRVSGVPEVAGTAPMTVFAEEVLTPGAGQLRALLVCSGNVATSAPGSAQVAQALAALDLLVCLDPYVTETSLHAHYILPPTLWLERDTLPFFTLPNSAVPYMQWAPAVVAPLGEARDDWWIVEQIAERIGIDPCPIKLPGWLRKLGLRMTPARLFDIAVRLGPCGDLFGLRRNGLNRKKLWANPGGIKLADAPPTGVLAEHVFHADKRVHLDQPLMVNEMTRLRARSADVAGYPLRLITIRELRSHNSWMHNIPKLMSGDRLQRLQIHPVDARALSIENGGRVEVASRHGSIQVVARLTDDVRPGVLALPQGWGHRGRWKVAVRAGGAGYNTLAGSGRDNADRLSGQAIITGLPVRLRKIAADAVLPVEAVATL